MVLDPRIPRVTKIGSYRMKWNENDSPGPPWSSIQLCSFQLGPGRLTAGLDVSFSSRPCLHVVCVNDSRSGDFSTHFYFTLVQSRY
jgi:hypothetical protein